MYYITTQSPIIAPNIGLIAKSIKMSLMEPALFLVSFGLFFRWGKAGIEGFGTEMLMTFIPQSSLGVSWKLVGICLGSTFCSLLTGLASDWFYPTIKEARILTIW